jgi:short-subunit dehydrogenase
MLEQGEGHVVNTASMAGHFGSPFQSPYVSTKFAVVGLSESLHHELLGTPVGVSVLCPGLTATNIAAAERNWPARLGSLPEASCHPASMALDAFAEGATAGGQDPSVVAASVVEAIHNDRFWIFPDDSWNRIIQTRHDELIARANPSLPML